jgi:hypothetical protein
MKTVWFIDAKIAIARIALLCFLFFLCVCYNTARAASIDDYFSVTDNSSASVHIKCRFVVSDISPEWSRLLLAGFLYASSISGNNENLSVTFMEQDGYTYTYTVRKTDLWYFIDDRTTLNTFLKRITMRKSR